MGMCIPQQNGSQNNFQELCLCFLMSPVLNLDCQASQQAPLPAEPFASPVCQKFLICLELSSNRNLMLVEYVNLSPCSQKVTACVNMHCGIWCIHYNSGVVQQPVKSSIRITPVTFQFVVHSYMWIAFHGQVINGLLKEWHGFPTVGRQDGSTG